VALAHPIVSLVLDHGSFDLASGDLTARTLMAFAFGLPMFSTYLYAMRGFYAVRDTRTPFIINLGENVANVVVGFLLLDKFGVVGLASAFSIAYAIFGVVALIVLQRRIGRILEPRTLRALARQLLASAAMIIVMTLGNHLLRVNALTQLLLVGTAGVTSYVLCLIALRSEETQLVMARVRRR
jgi:putative peptidoglycan lipid II flippase